VLIGNRQTEVARAVAPLLQVSENELVQRLMPRLGQTQMARSLPNPYVVLEAQSAG